MASPDNFQQKNQDKAKETPQKTDKPNFSGFLRAVNVDRLNPANTPEKPLLLKKKINAYEDRVFNVRLLQATGIIVSAMWLIGASLYVQRVVGWSKISTLMPHEMGGFLAGILTPIALFWMIAAFILRSNDVKMYAEALRDEIQGIMFPSEEANRRVNNDIERLMRQTAEMSKATRIALTAIEAARAGLQNQVAIMNDGSEVTVDRLTNLSKSLNDRMKDAAQMGAQLEETITKIEKSATAAEQKLTSSNAQLNDSVAKIDQSATTTEEAVTRLSQMLRERLEALGNLHEETEEALQNAASELASQREELRFEAKELETKAMNVADALQNSTTKLYDFTDDALDKAKLIETRLQGQTTSLQNILSQSNDNADAIETATTGAVTKLKDVATQASTESSRIESVLQQAIDRLEDRTQSNVTQIQNSMENVTTRLITDVDAVSTRAKEMTDTMLTEVNRKVMDTTAAFAYIQKQIQSLVGLFDERKLQLDATGSSARQTAEAMHTTLQAALDKVQATANAVQSGIGAIHLSVNEPITLLENAATMAHQRAGDISQLLTARATEMSDASTKMSDDVQALQQQLYSKGQDVALLAGKIASHLKTVSQELEHQNTTLDSRLSVSLESLNALNTRQKDVVANLEKLQEQTATTTQQTENSAETIQQRIALLQQLHKSLAGDAATSKSELDRVSDRLVSISSSTVDKIKNTIESMTLLEADYHRLSDAGIDSIARLEKGYNSTMKNIQAETELTAEKIAELQNGIEEKTQQASQNIQSHLSNITQTADTITQSMNKVTDFGDTIALHTSRIADLGKHFTKGNEQITITAQSVQDTLSQLKDHTIEAVDSFIQQNTDLEQQITHQVARLNDVNQKFVYNTNELKDTLAATEAETEALTDKLQSHITTIREEGETAGSVLDQLLGKIVKANDTLNEQHEGVNRLGDDIMANLHQATLQIGNKAQALEQAAKVAQHQADTLRAQENRISQQAFFNSTKFIVESLHSLALDFTRMLEGELEEKTWRGYQKGDMASFTRRLLSSRDEDTKTKIRTKFKEDVEFRTYVQRYLRQFEEIYDSADRNDHANLLTSVFTSSDVGKLYQFICTILERDARGVKKA